LSASGRSEAFRDGGKACAGATERQVPVSIDQLADVLPIEEVKAGPMVAVGAIGSGDQRTGIAELPSCAT